MALFRQVVSLPSGLPPGGGIAGTARRFAGVATAGCLFVVSLGAGVRSGGDYAISSESVDAAGLRVSSADYRHDGCFGGLAGVFTTVGGTHKSGYLGRLYEAVAFQLVASPATVNEGASRQITGRAVLDDATDFRIPAEAIAWSVLDGPLAGIGADGFVTALAVYQNAAAPAQGVYAGRNATLDLTVLDTLPDNFGLYAADGLDDDWQVLHFGQNNPAAGPLLDPDGDGQDNLFEFTAGLVPTDAASSFVVTLGTPPGQPLRRSIVFSPRLAGRSYTVTTSTTLADWTELEAFTLSDAGTTRTVTDLDATDPVKFYRVEITKP